MTKPSQKKTTNASSLAAKTTPKKGQSTLKTAWDKKGSKQGSSNAQTATVPDTPTAPMTENTQPANDATDTKMRTPPEPHSPPSPKQRSSALSKCLKADDDDASLDALPVSESQLTDTNKQSTMDQPTPESKTAPPAQPITPALDPSVILAQFPLPASPPLLKPRGRPPPTLPN